MKHKIGRELEVELISGNINTGVPEHVNIRALDSRDAIVIWRSDDAFKLAYKLMSLASEMK